MLVTKTAAQISARALVEVVAFNIAGAGAINDAWSQNGLDFTTTLACGQPTQCQLPGRCNVIWVLADCEVVRKLQMRLNINASIFTAATRTLSFEIRPMLVAEGTFALRLFIPVSDNVTWSYQTIDGNITVQAVADAEQSLLWLCQGLSCNATCTTQPCDRLWNFSAQNAGAAPLIASVLARDVDGFSILRDGEQIIIILTHTDKTQPQIARAVYSDSSQRYVAEFRGLLSAGLYSMSLSTPLGEEIRANLTISCPFGYSSSPDLGGLCQPAVDCTDAQGWYVDQNVCKRKPLMAVRTSNTKLTIIVEKGKADFVADDGAMELRLQSGDVDFTSNVSFGGVVWHASSSAAWFRLLHPSGMVHSRDTVDFISYFVDVTGLADTSASGPLRAQIFVNSSMLNGTSGMFVDGSDRLAMPVELVIRAEVCVRAPHVSLRSSEGEVADGSTVSERDSLLLTVKTYDCELLPIFRTDQIVVMYLLPDSSQPREMVLRFSGRENEYIDEVPASWLKDAGDYVLSLAPNDTAVVRSFSVLDKSKFYTIFSTVAASLLGVFVAIMIFFAYRHRRRAKQVIISFLEFEMVRRHLHQPRLHEVD